MVCSKTVLLVFCRYIYEISYSNFTWKHRKSILWMKFRFSFCFNSSLRISLLSWTIGHDSKTVQLQDVYLDEIFEENVQHLFVLIAFMFIMLQLRGKYFLCFWWRIECAYTVVMNILASPIMHFFGAFRRSTEISLVIRQTLEACILTHLMPRSQVQQLSLWSQSRQDM